MFREAEFQRKQTNKETKLKVKDKLNWSSILELNDDFTSDFEVMLYSSSCPIALHIPPSHSLGTPGTSERS